jgi:hypothetical protein
LAINVYKQEEIYKINLLELSEVNMHQTENNDPSESALNKLFSNIDLLSSKMDEVDERIDYLASFVGLEIGEEGKEHAEPPGQLAGLSLDVLNKLLSAKDANALRAYF